MVLSNRFRSPAFRHFLLALSLAGCAGRGSTDNGALPDAEGRRRSTIATDQVAESAPEATFTAITSLDTDSRGRVYVGDWYRQQVTVLNADGTVAQTFGRRGDGPGEFRAIRGVQILAGDSLLVYDPTLARVSVYAPGGAAPAYTANLRFELAGPAPFHLWRTPANDGYLALFRPTFAFSEGASLPPRNDALRLLELNGATRAEIKAFPSKGFLVSGSSVTPNPFGREGLAVLDSRGQVHFLWNDSLAIESFGPDGRALETRSLPYSPRPVTRQDAERQTADWDGQSQATYGRVLQDSTPAHWPAAAGMLVDDHDRIWIALAGDASATEWIVLSADKRYLASVVLPARVTLRAVSGSLLYAERLNDDDVPAVVTYRAAGLPE